VTGSRPVRIANCSGFFGDRISAAREMVEGGPIDVLTGDWLAELTMLILWKQRARDATAGYASTFLTQVEQVLGSCLDRGIKIVANAGGLNPAGCAERVRTIAAGLGLDVRVAHVEGDDLLDRVEGLRPQLAHLDTGEPLRADPVTANAYLGGWGITTALDSGADVVVCPRVTDAALVTGPAAWWWGWAPDDWDRLAGAVVAGHVIECGAQATGGNYAFFAELPARDRPLGFPIAEVDHDGSSVIAKHPGTGGAVTVGTVTAQLLYEIANPAYASPDVIARFDTCRIDAVGPDRVGISGTRGEPAPTTAKVALNLLGGYRNRMTFVLTGLDQEAKAAWALAALGDEYRPGPDVVTETRLVPRPADGPDQESASGLLHVTVKGADERSVGRAFSSSVVALALANYPGFFATTAPGPAEAYGVFWPALVDADEVTQTVVLDDGTRLPVPEPPGGDGATAVGAAPVPPDDPAVPCTQPVPGQPLGAWFGSRSGDKGGNANLGVWARDAAGYRWLLDHLTVDALRGLLVEVGELAVDRFELPNLRAVNFVVHGLLGEGVAASSAFDPQAKGLGEYLRSRPVPAGS
jgi:Acyclic terpene utilisation family protein AtuA